MKYLDPVYGSFDITSPVLLELIASVPIQRLKKIGQFGIPDKYYHKKNFSRYDHCMGVMLVLISLGASEEEQAAGLLHDASHTAFSHVIDFVIRETGGEESYQDERHGDIILHPPVFDTLKKYGYSPEKFLHHEHFSLLEQPIPNACADRIDYALQEFPLLVAQECFRNVRSHEGRIVFATQAAARLFGENFLNLQINHWSGLEAMSRYHHFARALRLALHEGTLTMADFWNDDDYVLAKLEHTKDPFIIKILSALEEKSLSHHPLGDTPEHKKFRFVDPEFLENGSCIRLSSRDEEFKQNLEKARRLNQEGRYISTLGLPT